MIKELPERCDFAPGDFIDEEFKVVKLLGEGNFGVVYQVTDNKDREYALKILPLWKRETNEREDLSLQFQKEFEVGHIASDYLVYSYFYDWIHGNPYFLMDYCPNGDLYSVLEDKKSDFELLMCQILLGLKALHTHNKVYRDLKPANILITRNGTAVLSDFGTCDDIHMTTSRWKNLFKKTESFGTFAYMSPEQMNPKKSVSTSRPTTDIFSFGVMLYELLFKKYPFGALESKSDLKGYAKNVENGKWDATVFNDKESKVGKFWKEIIAGCLEPDYKKRFQKVDDVLEKIPYYKDHKVEDSAAIPPVGKSKGMILRIVHGEELGKIYNLNDFLAQKQIRVTIGRYNEDCTNDIDLVDNKTSYISRKHCTLEYENKKWYIKDGQSFQGEWYYSTNGTSVNFKELYQTEERMLLNAGDTVSIGKIRLSVENLY